MAARCRRLTTWTLLLTLLCQSAVPCVCARCGYAGQSCDGKRLDEQCGLTSGCHSHGSGAHNTTAPNGSTRRHSRNQDTPGHVPLESPCRKLAAFVSAEGSSVRMTSDESRSLVPFTPDLYSRPSRRSALITLDLGPFDPPHLARGVRFQV